MVHEPTGNPPAAPGGVRLAAESAARPGRCTCGCRIETGGPTCRVAGASSLLEALFQDRMFCSSRCLRTFCLEALETLDAIDVESAALVVSDLHELIAEVGSALRAAS